MYSPGLKFPITCLSLRMCTYSGSSLKGHSRKQTDLLTAAFTKPYFHSHTDFYIRVNDQFTSLRAGSLMSANSGQFLATEPPSSEFSPNSQKWACSQPNNSRRRPGYFQGLRVLALSLFLNFRNKRIPSNEISFASESCMSLDVNYIPTSHRFQRLFVFKATSGFISKIPCDTLVKYLVSELQHSQNNSWAKH